MKTLKKVYDGIVEVEGWIAVVALVAAIVLNAYEILQRNLWGNSFIWIQEISVLLMLWFAMLGLPKVANDNADICLDLFINKLPPSARKIVDLLVAAMLVFMNYILLVNLYKLYLSQGNNVTIVARYPLKFRSYALFLGIGTTEIKYIANTVKAALAVLGKKGGDEK
nr:TRAP transporter small permease subunit [Clostridium sp. Marseille-P7770]